MKPERLAFVLCYTNINARLNKRFKYRHFFSRFFYNRLISFYPVRSCVNSTSTPFVLLG